MSMTPRTDNTMWTLYCGPDGNGTPEDVVHADFARVLEVELSTAKEKEAESANVILQFMDRIDLNRDEFLRIKAIATSPEIVHLCERSQVRITQTVPVIEQRDKAQKEVAALRALVGRMREELMEASKQKRLSEMNDDERHDGDFEYAYDQLVASVRRAIEEADKVVPSVN